MNYLLLQLIPGLNNTVPGIEKDYLPEQGAAAAAEIFEKTYGDAWIIFGLMVIISLAFSVYGLGQNWEIKTTLKRIASIALLLVGFKLAFGGPFIIGHALSIHIFSEDNVAELNKKFEERATEEQEKKGVAEDKDETIIGRLFKMIGQIQTDIVVDALSAIIAFIFFIAATLMHMLWRVALIILYITGPILIALSIIPGFGVKLLTAWFGAVLQVSFWQVWFAICAFFVQTSDKILTFTVGDSKAATANHVESVVFALIFTILYIGTPFIVGVLFPTSAFSSGLTQALRFGGYPVSAGINTAASLASAGAGGALSGAKGLLGFIGSKLSREAGTGSANAASGAASAVAKPGLDKGSSLNGAILTGAKANSAGTSPENRAARLQKFRANNRPTTGSTASNSARSSNVDRGSTTVGSSGSDVSASKQPASIGVAERRAARFQKFKKNRRDGDSDRV